MSAPVTVSLPILVPIDFSDCCRRALATAKVLSEQQKRPLKLLHVQPVMEIALLDVTYVQPSEQLTSVQAALAKRLASWADGLMLPKEQISYEVVVGSPVREIVRRSKDASLIVMGTHGRSGVSHFLLGSVAERVVQGASCSVFIVKDEPT